MFDARGILGSFWLTFLVTSIGSTTMERNPQTVADALPLVMAFWTAALLCGLGVGLLRWPDRPTGMFASALTGFGLAAIIRLLILNLPATMGRSHSFWEFLWNMVNLEGVSGYYALLLLIGLGSMLLLSVVWFWQTLILPLPDLSLHNRTFSTAFALMSINLITLVLIRSAREDVGIQITASDWLTAPVPNMLLATSWGAAIGLAYRANNALAAAVTAFAAVICHLIIMLLLEVLITGYSLNPFYTGLDLRQPPLVRFTFFWGIAPVVGATAAFALHNLRDAFRYEVQVTE
jgi:hypothetical protein